MGKHDYLYSLSYEGKLRDGFAKDVSIDFLINNFKVDKAEAQDLLENEFSVCKHTSYNDVLRVHKEFYAAGIVLKLEKDPEPKKSSSITEQSIAPIDKRSQASNIVVRECIS